LGHPDASEERYWIEKFGLGRNAASIKLYANNRKALYAHPKHVTLQVGTAAMVHQIIIGTTATAPEAVVATEINMNQQQTQQQQQQQQRHSMNGVSGSSGSRNSNPTITSTSNVSHIVKHTLMAAVCGPRVPLYGTTPQSKIHRILSNHTTTTSTKFDPAVHIEADRNVPTGGQLALSASLRTDGRLLAIGTDSGVIRVADTTTRATLCQWGSSTKTNRIAPLPIRAVHWFRNGQHLLSMGDDATVRVWRLHGASAGPGSTSTAMQKPILECQGHGDAIRCGALWQQQQQQKSKSSDARTKLSSYGAIAATGSYDHTIRLWNMENLDDHSNVDDTTIHKDRCIYVLHHGGPVEAVVWVRSTNPSVPVWLISAGGTVVKVWNPVTGMEVGAVQVQHRKTVTCMLAIPRIRDIKYYDHHHTVPSHAKTTPSDMRVITGGLDGLMRVHVFDMAYGQLHFVHGISLNGISITALAATSTGDRIAIGTSSGTVLVCQKGSPIQQQPNKRTSEPTAGTFAFFTRGMNADASAGDHIVANSGGSSKKRKLSKYDTALKQFRYGDALDEALATRIPHTVIAVLEELGKRRGLTIALSNRDEESLEPILAFTVRYVSRPRFAALLIGVANKLIDIYAEVTGQSETIDELFVKLKDQVTEEIRTQKVLLRVVGQLDAILAQVEMNQQKTGSYP
jgi:U3 small nucleolar RNA-associated protein 15